MAIFARIALASFVAIFYGCRAERANPTVDLRVAVELGGSIDAISGVFWPTGKAVKTLAIEKPRTVTVRFPSGRSWTSYSKITFLFREDDTVSQVEIAPLKEAADFATALAKLQAILDELGVAADSPARERLKAIQTEPPAWDPSASSSLTAVVEEDVELFAEFKPTSQEGKWYLICSFYKNRQHVDPGETLQQGWNALPDGGVAGQGPRHVAQSLVLRNSFAYR